MAVRNFDNIGYVVIPIIEVAVRSITGSAGRGPNNVVQSLDPKRSSRSMENTASSRVDLSIDRDKNDESRKVENFEDGCFPAF